MLWRNQETAGEEEFNVLIESNGYYVDKTMYLRPLLTRNGRVSLFTRPRRFGKTLTMTMLRDFLQLDTKEPGNTLRQQRLFKGLAVMEDRELCEEFMGRYPVILLSLKGVYGRNFNEAKRSLATLEASIAIQYDYLLNSPNLNKVEKRDYGILLDGLKLARPLYSGYLEGFLPKLSNMLFKHFGRKVILLIDEYDVPLAKAQEKHFHSDMVDLYTKLLGVVKTFGPESPVLKIIMTGCLRVAKTQIFTGANNLSENTVLTIDSNFSSLFGFKPSEVDAYLNAFGLSEYKELVKANYDGYRFGGDEIYNPWDVGKFVMEARTKIEQGKKDQIRANSYWSGSESTNTTAIKAYVKTLSETDTQRLQDLSDGKEVAVQVKDNMRYDTLNRNNPTDMWSLLLHTGYLTAIKEIEESEGAGDREEISEGKGYQENEKSIENRQRIPRYLVRIPNAEIKQCFDGSIMASFDEEMRRDDTNIKVARALLSGDCVTVKDLLQVLLKTYINTRTFAMPKYPEFFYQSMLAILLTTRSGAEIDDLHVEPEAGDGYADVTFTSFNGEIAVVVELKVARTKEALNSAVKAALKQIEDRNYAKEFIESGRVNKVIAIGMAFCKRVCEADCKILKGAVPANPE